MKTTFKLKIELGNLEMCTTFDLTEALRTTIKRLENGVTEGSIYDTNGNRVGEFSLPMIKEDEVAA